MFKVVKEILTRADIVFWDFDGVIKESVDAKSRAFEKIFCHCSSEIRRRIVEHHLKNGGMSRYKKIPLYLNWCGEKCERSRVDYYADKFSELAACMTISSPWVPGVREYIEENYRRQIFVITSATPQGEIRQIAKELEISHCFKEIYGTPMLKSDAIKLCLHEEGMIAKQAVYCGDSKTDIDAANENQVRILLRRTEYNKELQKKASMDMWVDLK